MSRDVDLFLHDAQALAALSPRLNGAAAALTDSYDEGASFLKLAFAEGEVDFIVAPSLLGLAPEPMSFEGRPVACDATAEILAKKLFYRTASLKVRDVFDLGVVLERDSSVAALVGPVLRRRAAQLQRRLARLAPAFERRATTEIAVIPGGAPPAAVLLQRARDFVDSLG